MASRQKQTERPRLPDVFQDLRDLISWLGKDSLFVSQGESKQAFTRDQLSGLEEWAYSPFELTKERGLPDLEALLEAALTVEYPPFGRLLCLLIQSEDWAVVARAAVATAISPDRLSRDNRLTELLEDALAKVEIFLELWRKAIAGLFVKDLNDVIKWNPSNAAELYFVGGPFRAKLNPLEGDIAEAQELLRRRHFEAFGFPRSAISLDATERWKKTTCQQGEEAYIAILASLVHLRSAAALRRLAKFQFSSERIRAAAMRLLGFLGDEPAIQRPEERLCQYAYSGDRNAVRALERLGTEESRLALMCVLAEARSTEVRVLALRALGWEGLKVPVMQVAGWAMKGVRWIKGPSSRKCPICLSWIHRTQKWLDKYTFPDEKRVAIHRHCRLDTDKSEVYVDFTRQADIERALQSLPITSQQLLINCYARRFDSEPSFIGVSRFSLSELSEMLLLLVGWVKKNRRWRARVNWRNDWLNSRIFECIPSRCIVGYTSESLGIVRISNEEYAVLAVGFYTPSLKLLDLDELLHRLDDRYRLEP